VAHVIPTATPGINQQRPLDRLTLASQKNKTKQKLNNKKGTGKEHAAEGAMSTPEMGAEAWS
jgi:hypothetical protein